MKYVLLFLSIFMISCANSQEANPVDIKNLGAKGDGITDATAAFKNARKYKIIRIPRGRYMVDRTQLPFTNFILDSGAEIVSNTYAAYLPGKILRSQSYKQTKFNYKYYNPFIDVTTVLQARKDTFQYNHDAAITYFDGYFYVFWNGLARGGNEVNSEGTKGQLNYMSRSTDTKHWSIPVAIFNDPEYTNNPLPSNPREGQQWQPNVISLSDRMLIIWTETGQHTASYISILLKGRQKVTTYRIDIDKRTKAIKLNNNLASQPEDGYSLSYPGNGNNSYFIYSTQNPYQLTTGRLLIPFSVEELTGKFTARLKWASFIYTDNPTDLTTYKFAGLTQGSTPSSAWEPFFSEGRDGTVYMHMRNLGPAIGENKNERNTDIASSSDGLIFGQAVAEGLIGPSARAYCERVSNNRFMLAYNDADKNLRINGSIYFSRYGSEDFTPGVSLQKNTSLPGDVYLNYPQSTIYRDTAYVVYSGVYEPRSIMLAKFRLGLPDDSLLIVPRNRPRIYMPGYADQGKHAIALTGSKSFRLKKPVIAGDRDVINSRQSLTVSAWVDKQNGHNLGTLFDNRGNLSGTDYFNKGLVIGTSFISLGTTGPGINLTANLNYNFNKTGYKGLINQLLSNNAYLGVTVNTLAKVISVYMDNGTYNADAENQFYEANYYWQAVEVSAQFREGQTITIDNKTFTFTNGTSSGPSDVPIGQSIGITCSNLKSKMKDVITVGWSQPGGFPNSKKILLVFFKYGSPLSPVVSTSNTVKNYDGNFIDGPGASIGSSIPNSGIAGFVGYLYNMRIYKGHDGAKSAAFHKYLYNKLCRRFNYPEKTGASGNSDNYYANIQYDDLGDVVNVMGSTSAEYSFANNFLTLYSNSSAGMETDGDNYSLNIPFKVNNFSNAAPVICTFEDREHSYPVTIDKDGVIRCNGTIIKTVNPGVVNTLAVTFKNNTVSIYNTFSFQVVNRPVMFLGASNFFSPMNGNYFITYDLNGIKLNVIN